MQSTVKKHVEVTAVLYPACTCGLPWASHGDCGGYIPCRPIQNLGTVAFQSPSMFKTLLWKLEQTLHSLRTKV